MQQPFEVPFADVETRIETYIDSVYASLRSEFLTLPKGEGFVEYPIFEEGYEALKRQTGNNLRLGALHAHRHGRAPSHTWIYAA